MKRGKLLRIFGWVALGATLFLVGMYFQRDEQDHREIEHKTSERSERQSGKPSGVSSDEGAGSPRDLPVSNHQEEYFLRPEGEWQGYRVSKSDLKRCATTAVCRRGLACSENKCGACSADAPCLDGEMCVLDHCIPKSQVECLRRVDCEQNGYCVLVGSTSGKRGNENLRAVCMAEKGLNPYHQPPEEVATDNSQNPFQNPPTVPVQSDLAGNFTHYFPERATKQSPAHSDGGEE